MVTLDLNPYTLNREVMPGLPRKGKHVGDGGGGAARGVALLELAQPPLALALDLSCVQRAAAAAVGVVYYRGGLLSLPSCLPSLRCGWKLRTKRTGGDRIKGLWNEMMGLGDPLTSHLILAII